MGAIVGNDTGTVGSDIGVGTDTDIGNDIGIGMMGPVVISPD